MDNWKTGDWAVFDRSVVQIKEIRDAGACSVSDGWFETSGRLLERLRPLTLRNKCIAERFEHWYDELRKINGEAGFNYPDISRHFSQLALQAMDDPSKDEAPFNAARDFISDARDYKPIIQGIGLFRPKYGRA